MKPDMVVIGKGTANGLPISAVVVCREVAGSIAGHKGFTSTPSDRPRRRVAAAQATLKVIKVRRARRERPGPRGAVPRGARGVEVSLPGDRRSACRRRSGQADSDDLPYLLGSSRGG